MPETAAENVRINVDVIFGPAVSFPEPFTSGGMNDKFDIGAIGSFSGAPSDVPGLGSIGIGAKLAVFGSIDAGDIQGQRGVGASIGGQFGFLPPVTGLGLGLGLDLHFGRTLPEQPIGFSGAAVSVGLGTEVHANINVTGSFSLRGTLTSMWSSFKNIFSSNENSNEKDGE